MKSFISDKTFEVPNPENCLLAPLLLVVEEDDLETDVGDARETPAQNPGHCLLVRKKGSEQISLSPVHK